MPHINATFRNSSTVISTETEISASSLNALKFESLRFFTFEIRYRGRASSLDEQDL